MDLPPLATCSTDTRPDTKENLTEIIYRFLQLLNNQYFSIMYFRMNIFSNSVLIQQLMVSLVTISVWGQDRDTRMLMPESSIRSDPSPAR